MALNTEFVEEWVAALRSGDYVQGHSTLRTMDNKFCCLGVACDLLEKKGLLLHTVDEDEDENYDIHEYSSLDPQVGDLARAVLPVAAAEYIGMDVWGHLKFDENTHTSLTTINDNDASTFEDIADLIEGAAFGDFGYQLAEGVFEVNENLEPEGEKIKAIYQINYTFEGKTPEALGMV